jgi:hypothetical protein
MRWNSRSNNDDFFTNNIACEVRSNQDFVPIELGVVEKTKSKRFN